MDGASCVILPNASSHICLSFMLKIHRNFFNVENSQKFLWFKQIPISFKPCKMTGSRALEVTWKIKTHFESSNHTVSRDHSGCTMMICMHSPLMDTYYLFIIIIFKYHLIRTYKNILKMFSNLLHRCWLGRSCPLNWHNNTGLLFKGIFHRKKN